MEIPIDAHIPKKYIPRETGRISMYKRIAAITDIDSFRDVQDELIDRYGEIPRSVQNLLDIALYKSRAAQLGILNFTVRPEEVRFTFGADAPLDGAKLFAAVGTIDGAAFAAGEKLRLSSKTSIKPVKKCSALHRMRSTHCCSARKTQVDFLFAEKTAA